jgi:hypothetical protein
MVKMAGTLWISGDHDRAVIIFRTAAQQFPDRELIAKLRRDLPRSFLGLSKSRASAWETIGTSYSLAHVCMKIWLDVYFKFSQAAPRGH